MSAPVVSRGLTGLVAAILGGGLSVAFLVTAMAHANTMLIFLAYFAALPLYLAGLGAGAIAGLVASIAGMLALFLTQPPNFAFIYAFVYAIPAVAVATLALRHRVDANGKVYWYPEGNILTAITLYPCILFLVAVVATSSHPGGLLDFTERAFAQVGTQLAHTFPDDQAQFFQAAVASAAKIAPALAAYSWIIVMILSLTGAQRILRKQGWQLREDFSLLALHVPNQLIYGVAITGLFGVLASEPYSYVGRNLSMIMGLPFFFIGLAVFHSWFNAMRTIGRVCCYVSFYIVLAFAPWLALIVAAIGVIDQWVNFRQRIARNMTV